VRCGPVSKASLPPSLISRRAWCAPRAGPTACLAPLFRKTGWQFVSLQRDLRPGDDAILRQHPNVIRCDPTPTDFADTAALVTWLDIVVCVDTAIAHLAGALGKPLLLLLPYAADFRWLRGREDSPWYPTARLLRQAAFGDWDSVVQRLPAISGMLVRMRPQSDTHSAQVCGEPTAS